MKRIVILGTNHCVQWRDYEGTNQFEQVLRILSAKYSTQVVLEEWTPREAWCPSSMSTVGHKAHLHSMAEKLTNVELAIEAYQWQRPEN
jgi:hypothetical protein